MESEFLLPPSLSFCKAQILKPEIAEGPESSLEGFLQVSLR